MAGLGHPYCGQVCGASVGEEFFLLYDGSTTTLELKEARIDIAVLPIGAIEQHSVHLPVGTDWINVQALSRRMAEWLARDRDVYLLPAFPFSLSQCHGAMPGTVWLKPETLANVLRDLVLSLYEQGIEHVAVVDGHGGNFVLDAEIRELNGNFPDLMVIKAVSWDRNAGGSGDPGEVGRGDDIHAGAGETSTQLHLNPEHVRSQRVDHVPAVGREYLDYAYMEQISPWGVWGRPSQGTARAGERALECAASRMARNVLRAFDLIDDLRGRRNDDPL